MQERKLSLSQESALDPLALSVESILLGSDRQGARMTPRFAGGNCLAATAAARRFGFQFSRSVLKRVLKCVVDVGELRLDGFFALLQFSLEIGLLLAGQSLKPDVAYCP